MSNSMSAPWLQQWVLSLLEPRDAEKEHLNASNKQPVSNSKVVQVIAVNEKAHVLTINDKAHTLMVMLTPECHNALTYDSPLRDLQGSLVKLLPGQYHLSTVFQSSGTRDIKSMKASTSGVQFSLPLAMQVSALSKLGAVECNVFTLRSGANPVDINRDESVRKSIQTMTYPELVLRLALKQFPTCGGHLPDVNGAFLIPPRISDENPMLPVHTSISSRQRQLLDRIETYDRIRILEFMASANKALLLTSVDGLSPIAREHQRADSNRSPKKVAQAVDDGTQREDDSQQERDRRAVSYVQQMMMLELKHPAAERSPDSSGGMVLAASGRSPVVAPLTVPARASTRRHAQLPPFSGGTRPPTSRGSVQVKLISSPAVTKVFPKVGGFKTKYVWVQIYAVARETGLLQFYLDEKAALAADALYAQYRESEGDAWELLAKGTPLPSDLPNSICPAPVPVWEVMSFTVEKKSNKDGHRLALHGEREELGIKMRFPSVTLCNQWKRHLESWSSYSRARREWFDVVQALQRSPEGTDASATASALSPPLGQRTPATQAPADGSLVGTTITAGSLPSVSQLTQTQDILQHASTAPTLGFEAALLTQDLLESQEHWFNAEPNTQAEAASLPMLPPVSVEAPAAEKTPALDLKAALARYVHYAGAVGDSALLAEAKAISSGKSLSSTQTSRRLPPLKARLEMMQAAMQEAGFQCSCPPTEAEVAAAAAAAAAAVSPPRKSARVASQVKSSGSKNSGSTAVTSSSAEKVQPEPDLLGAAVQKFFPGYGWFSGTVQSYRSPFYWLAYEDGDYEELREQDARKLLVTTPSQETANSSQSAIPSVQAVSRASLDSMLLRYRGNDAGEAANKARSLTQVERVASLAAMLMEDVLRDKAVLQALLHQARSAEQTGAAIENVRLAVQAEVENLRSQVQVQAESLVYAGWATDGAQTFAPHRFRKQDALLAAQGPVRVLAAEVMDPIKIAETACGTRAVAESQSTRNRLSPARPEPVVVDNYPYPNSTNDDMPDYQEVLTQPQVSLGVDMPVSLSGRRQKPSDASISGISATSSASGQKRLRSGSDVASDEENGDRRKSRSSLGELLKKRRESLGGDSAVQMGGRAMEPPQAPAPEQTGSRSSLGILLQLRREGKLTSATRIAPVISTVTPASFVPRFTGLGPSGRPLLGTQSRNTSASTTLSNRFNVTSAAR